MKYLKSFKESLAGIDTNLETIERCKDLNEGEFLELLKMNCKNFSFNNDMLWRSKVKGKKSDLQLFQPSPRNAKPVAFPNFFNQIADDSNFPVKRKNSLIGSTDPEKLKILVGDDLFLVIPYDNSEIVFCPIIDLWALSDNRRGGSELVDKTPISEDNFIMVNYTSDFKVPLDELSKLNKAITHAGVEFFTSSKCLLLHESKIDWLRNFLK